ncbi:MAG: hypothetical protein ABI867_36675 [Kofleriaceae bacterium]
MMRALAAAIVLASRIAVAEPVIVHAELDPLTFANGGYGGQIGIRHPALHGVRLAIASFSLHVPDAISQIGGNDGFDVRVQPSGALYALYYLRPASHDGFAIGGSLRYLRYRYEHDDVPDTVATTTELSPELIVGYQWHPFHNGFYVQPWFALGVTVVRDAKPIVGDREYDPLPVSPFFTVNLGFEHGL